MPDIQHLIEIKAPAETVFALVSTPQGLSRWWAEDVFDEAENVCSLGFFNRQTVYRLRIASLAPNSTVIWNSETGSEWEGTTIRFGFEELSAGTRVRFVHANWQSDTDYFTSCNTTWGELMHRLMATAEGKGIGPLFKKDGLGY